MLLPVYTRLFELIYEQRKIPEQWLLSKLIPGHKKGNNDDITNYRPIANLCCSSKVFERLILNRIIEIETLNGVDLTGEDQLGFNDN